VEVPCFDAVSLEEKAVLFVVPAIAWLIESSADTPGCGGSRIDTPSGDVTTVHEQLEEQVARRGRLTDYGVLDPELSS